MLLNHPLWVYATILLIFFTGYMAVRSIYLDRKIDHSHIEQEGIIYLERMQEEKKRRHQ